MYRAIVCSFRPIVETKYPTLHILPSMYISRTNLNRCLILDARFDLELLHDGRYGEVRGYFDLEVNMIVIGIEGVYIQRRILPYYSVTGGDELFFNVFFQPFLSVASSPDEVILNLICTVV